MKNKRQDDIFYLGCHEIDLAEESKGKWVQILKVGEFRHPTYGKFSISPVVLRELCENFQRNIRGVKLAFDYEHGQSAAHGTKAAGWFKNLELRDQDTELWAQAEWTPEGQRGIEAAEWRYTSAEMLRNYEDAESGKRFGWVLKGAALTNSPFIKGMEAIAASEMYQSTHKKKEEKNMNLTEIKVTLAEQHAIDLNDLQARAARLPDVEAKIVALSDELTASKGAVSNLENERSILLEKIAAGEKEQADMRFAELVKTGMEDGKLTKAMAEGSFKTMFEKGGFDLCELFLADAQKIVPVGSTRGHGEQQAEGEKPDSKKSAGIQLTELATARAEKDKISFADACGLVFSEQPELAKRYENECPVISAASE